MADTRSLMTEGSIAKQIFFFSVPLILGNLLQQLYNTADSIIVGNFVGSAALAAVGSSASLIGLLISFAQGAAVGAGVVIAQYLGAQHRAQVERAVHNALAIALLLGVLLSVGGVVLSQPLLQWMDTPQEVMGESVAYLKLYFVGVVFSVIYNMAASILNAAGNSKRSLLYLGIASVTNIILDLLLVGVFHLGVVGAALATDLSQFLSCALALAFLCRTRADYRVQLRRIRLHRKMAGRIVRIGLPTGIQNMVISFANVLVQSSVNGFGAAAMAGFGAYMKIDGFNILPVLSFSMAITTFVGQNIGAGRLDRVKKGTWVTLLMGIAYTVATGALLLIFAQPLMTIFSRDADVVAYGVLAMHYFCPFYWVLSILHELAGAVRGAGKSLPPTVVLLFSMCIFRIIWLQTALSFFDGIEGVFILYPISWAIGLVLMALYTWKGKWIQAVKL